MMIFKEHIETRTAKELYGTLYKDIIVRLTNKNHDSGFKMMTVIGIAKNDKKVLISECCDVITFATISNKFYNTVEMDIPKKNELHYFLRNGVFILDLGAGCSTVKFIAKFKH